jgi:hypothetical protein
MRAKAAQRGTRPRAVVGLGSDAVQPEVGDERAGPPVSLCDGGVRAGLCWAGIRLGRGSGEGRSDRRGKARGRERTSRTGLSAEEEGGLLGWSKGLENMLGLERERALGGFPFLLSF